MLAGCLEGHISEYYYCDEHFGKIRQLEEVFLEGWMCPSCNNYFTEILTNAM